MSDTQRNVYSVVSDPPSFPMFLPDAEYEAKKVLLLDGKIAGFHAFLERAESDSSDAQAVVATMILNRWLSNDNHWELAEYWAQKSASKGNRFGYWILAWVLIETGDFGRGLRYLVQSAEQGFSPAMLDLGYFLRQGVLIPKNESLGFLLIRAAASQGHRAAKRALALAAKAGHFGVLSKLVSFLSFPFFLFYLNTKAILGSTRFSENGLIYVNSASLRNKIHCQHPNIEVDIDSLEKMVD